MSKLSGLPSIHYITLRESTNRQHNLNRWFQEYNVTNYVPHVFERLTNFDEYQFVGKHVDSITILKPLIISHFSVLRNWYETTDEPYTLILEDDASFETVQYWNFNWIDFEKNLPDNWGCVQSAIIRYACEPYEFDCREPYRRGHWSACAYVIKREYVKHLLDTYNPRPNLFTLDIKGTDIIPEIEQILFLDLEKRVYVFPLFVEDCYNLTSTVSTNILNHRYSSHDCVMNWWKTLGKDLTIDEIFKGKN